MGTSRASLRMSGVGSDARRQSLGNQLNQFDRSTTASSLPLGSLNKLNFALSSSSTQQATTTTPPTISDSTIPDPLPTTTITPTATSMFSSPPQPCSTPPAPAPARIYIKIRDFGFPPTDERHLGLGADIPKANRVHRLNRKLGGPDRATARAAAALDPSSAASALATENGRSRRTDSIGSIGSVDSSDADVEEEMEDEGWGIGISGWGKGGSKGWDGFRLGMGRFSWNIKSNSNIRNGNEDSDNNKDKNSKGPSSVLNGIFPSRKDLDMNFMDSSSTSSSDDDDDDNERRGRRMANDGITEEFNDDDFDETVDDAEDREYEEPQEPLYPGLYRALYAFEPEGMAEMELVEDQIVRVVGRGGGIGWAVVVDERGEEVEGKVQVKHALVPEGYLEAVRLDWEDEEEEGLEVVENEDGDGDAVVVKAGDA